MSSVRGTSVRNGRTVSALFAALALLAMMALPAGGAWAQDHRPGDPQGEARGHQGEPDATHGEARGHDDEAGEPRGEAPGHQPEPGEPRGEAPGQDGEAASRQDESGDPNRGTVKIRDEGYDGSPRNEPHVGCDFSIVFLGFDADGSRDFWIHVHPPTAEDDPGETLAYSGQAELEHARGEEASSVYGPIHVSELDGLTEANRHDQQGWHLKLTVDGPKHDVFWLDCDDVGAEAHAVTEGDVTEVEASGLGGGVPAPDRTSVEDAGVQEVTQVLAAGETRLGLAGWHEDAAAADISDERLPATGADLLVLLAIASGMTIAGTLILRRGRQPV